MRYPVAHVTTSRHLRTVHVTILYYLSLSFSLSFSLSLSHLSATLRQRFSILDLHNLWALHWALYPLLRAYDILSGTFCLLSHLGSRSARSSHLSLSHLACISLIEENPFCYFSWLAVLMKISMISYSIISIT